jgi:hypothetical protein
MCSFYLAEKAYLQQNEPFSTLKTMVCMMHTFQKLAQFSQGKKMLHPAASNIDGFLWRDT